MRFKFIVCGVNHQAWLPRCLESIDVQTIKNFDVAVVDDATPDVNFHNWIRSYCDERGWLSILNEEHKGNMYNQVHAIRALQCEPEDVLVFLDGDDRLEHERVLERLMFHYSDGSEVVYGQYRSDPFSPTCSPARSYPARVVADNDYRAYGLYGGGLLVNHLRTVKYKLFAQLDDSDFKDGDGNWFKSCADTAVMIPCMELARGKVKCLENEILYVYNSENPQSDWRRQARQVDADHDYILRVLKKKI